MPLVHEERSGYAIPIDRTGSSGRNGSSQGFIRIDDQSQPGRSMLTRMKPSPIASSLAIVRSPTWNSRRWLPGSRALTFQQTSRRLRTRTGPAATSTASVGRRLTAGQDEPASPASLSVITESSPTRSGRAWYQRLSWPRTRVTGKAMTSIGTTARTNSRPAPSEDPPLGPQRHRGAVLEQLQGQEVGVDVVPDALDRAAGPRCT